MCQSCRFIVKWTVLPNSRLSCKVSSCKVWLNIQWMSRQCNQMSLICVGRQQKLFFLFHQHTVVKLFFNDITIFKTRHRYQLQAEDDIRWALTTTGPYFDKLVKQTQRKILIETCECGRWTEFARTGVLFILVVSIYLESAKIYTGPKILRVLKRLRNTGLSYDTFCFTFL